MDPAQAVVHAALFRQDAMNAVIDRGDSPIQQFYSDATVFVTGGSGFLGKQLIEKLFRSCEIKKMYMLIRCKKGRSIDARKKYILSDPLFETLRMKKPDFADRIILVEGDVGSLKLGLGTDCWKTLTKEVDTIFHVAATVKFDASLQTATLINVRGTREIIELAKQCINIKCLVYMSTAFSQATKNNIGKEVLEQLYTTPIRPKTMIKMAASMEKIQLDGITNSLIDGWPNTYTFTKALAEELINTTATDFPVCIVRPPIVLSSYTEPSPGWIDYNALYGPSGLVLGGALGFLHVLKIDVDNYFAIAPVDYVNNCAIAAGWDAKQKRQTGDTTVSIYNISNSKHFSKWKFIAAKIKESIKYYATPKAIWYVYLMETNNIVLYTLLAWLLHYIPAYVIDMVCTVTGKRPKGLKSFVDVYGRVDKSVAIFSYFTCNTWHFRNHNVETMISKMNKADQAIFNCDLNNIDPGEFIKLWYISIRKYIIKDGLKDSNVANAKQNRLRILNYLLLVIYFTLLFYFVYFLCSSIRIVLSILCY